MVLTRAQRAQTKATPPESPLKGSALSKAPARRGRAKQEEPAQEEAKPTRATKTAKAAPKTTPSTNDTALKASTSRAASARTATTKASAARVAAPKAGAARSAAAGTAPTKASAARTASKTAPKVPSTRKAATSSRSTKPTKSTLGKGKDETVAPVPEEVTENQSSQQLQESVVVRTDHAIQSQEDKSEATAQTHSEEADQAEATAPSSPTKLPRPVVAPAQPVSPFKSSLLSSVQGLGSVRKPAVSGTLLSSPTKLLPAPTQSVFKPALTNASPLRLNASVRDFASVIGSPRRPGSSGSDSSAGTPKRPHTDENVVPVSSKRLRTSMSMPSLGSPQRSQSSTSGSPPSPAKSSMRSPVKRPNMSPKKVSWHQTPPRPAFVQNMTPPPKQPGILDGCVFFLDINSLTGVNQNSLFVGLIEELGGQCVQEWSHNNMGITHVLFMNGELRTLEKVLASNGEVFCVSLGWLLDSQRECLRIPENQPRYLVDLTHVPGHTPKPNRSALNTPMTARSTAPVSHTPAIPPPKWALPNTPAVQREPLGALSSSLLIKTPSFLAATKTPMPPPSVGMGPIDDKENLSPISEATPLMQKTCPPKQFNKSGILATPIRNPFLASKSRRLSDPTRQRALGGAQSPPRRPLGLGSPKRMASPMKRSQFGV